MASYLQSFCVIGVIMMINMLYQSALSGMGRSLLMLKISIAGKIATTINISVMLDHGIAALIRGQILVGVAVSMRTREKYLTN